MTTQYNYKKLIEDFLSGKISSDQFQKIYIKKFLDDEDIEDDLFELLDFLFAEVDGLTDNEELLRKQPDFHFTAEQVKVTAKKVLQDIEKLNEKQ